MKKGLLATTALSVAVFVATSAKAQTTAETPLPPASSASQQSGPPAAAGAPDTANQPFEGVEDIIVTAQRRSENLQRAAVAVSAVSGETLLSANVTKPTDLAALVPSLQATGTEGPYALFYLRGIGTYSGNALSESPIAFNFNGVYIGRTSGTSGFFYDLDRVEVLKGPQGTLYGRNATGGAINLIPALPKLHDFSGYLTFAYGNYDTAQTQGAVNLPAGDKIAFRLAGFQSSHDPYLNDGTDDQNDYGGRLSMLAVPTDDLRINLMADYAHTGGTGIGAVIPEQGADHRWGLNSPEAGSFYETHPVLVAGRNFAALPGEGLFQKNHQVGISGNIEWTNPLGTLNIIPAYRYTRNYYNSDAVGFYLGEDQSSKQTSVEVRLSSDNNRTISYILGAYYFHDDFKDRLSINSQVGANGQDYDSGSKSQAVFGQLSIALTDTLKVDLGGRYTHDHKTFDGVFSDVKKLCLGAISPPYTGACPLFGFVPLGTVPTVTYPPGSDQAIPIFDFVEGTITTGSIIRASQDQTNNKFNYKFGLSWQVTPDNLIYGSFSTGYKAGGFFFTHDDGSYKPETIDAWTLGSKNRFFDGKLQVNLEAFYYRYKNMQISHVTADSQGSAIFATENVGKATFKGAEIEVRARPASGTTLFFDVQFLDAKYGEFQYLVPVSLAPTTTCRQQPDATFTFITVDCSGKRPINAPKWTIGVGGEQTIRLGSSNNLVLGGRVRYQTTIATGLEFTPIEDQSAYAMADAYARLELRDGAFSIEAFVNNLSNKTVITNSIIPQYASFTVSPVKPPRIYGVRAGVKF